MYGSARARVYYGAGDYNRAMTMAQGYYAAGGFFDFVKKAARVVGKVAASPIGGIAGKLLKGVPILGTAISIGEMAGGLASKYLGGRVAAGGVQLGPTHTAVKQLQSLPGGFQGMGGPGGKLPAFGPAGGAPRRRRRSKPRRSGGTSRRRRSRGDYGDDWQGNKPSRAKGSGQFLTRDGGRRRKRRGRRGRRGGQRVSFTTKSGKRVSFNAKGDGDAVA